MSGLASVLGIVALIAAVILVHVLRSALAAPLPARVQLRGMAQMRPPAVLQPLFDARDRELSALGFTPLTWVLVRYEPESVPGPRLMRLYRSEDLRTLAQVIAPFSLEEPLSCRVHLVSEVTDGRLLFTLPTTLTVIPHEPEVAIHQTGTYEELSAQWREHRELATRSGGTLAWLDAASALQRLRAYEQSVNQRAIYRGAVQPHEDGSLRLSPRRALVVLGLALSRRGSPAVAAADVPERRAALYWRNWKQNSSHAPRNQVQLGLFLISAIAFAVAGAWLWDPYFAVTLLAIIALHETGHWWTMRALGYRNLQMLMLPMVGGATIGHEQQPSTRDRAWVSLMGPLPGILLGAGLFAAGVDTGSGWLYLIALLLLLINLFNLLPLLPLDGGHLLHALLPETALKLRVAIDAVAVLVLLALAWRLGVWWLGLLALVPASALRHGPRERRWLETLREARRLAPPEDENGEVEQAFAVLRGDPDAPPLLLAQAPVVDQMLTQVRLQPMSHPWAAVIIITWLGCFALAATLPQVRHLVTALVAPEHSLASIEGRLEHLRAEAATLSDDDLAEQVLAMLSGERSDTAHAGLDPAELEAAERRIGQTLHPAYRALMRNGYDERLRWPLSLAEPWKLDRLYHRGDCLDWLDAEADWPGFSAGETVEFTVYDTEPASTEGRTRHLDRQLLGSWLAAGDCGDDAGHLSLIEPDRPEWPLWRISLYEPVASRQPSLRNALEEMHANLRFARQLRDEYLP